MYEIKRYTQADKQLWDTFVDNSKNATFLFKRDYMDYHSQRFNDHSLLFFDEKGRLIALLPGNTSSSYREKREEGCAQPNQPATDHSANLSFHSHQGLTYGGFILSPKTGTNEIMALFDDLITYLKENSFVSLHYKQIPTIYHLCPSQEDEYALWRYNATLEVCNISATIDLRAPIQPKFAHTRMSCIKACIRGGYTICEDDEIESYWKVLESCLKSKYNATPVHTLEEIQSLQTKFPNNIKCITVHNSNHEIVAGVIIYISKTVVHTQYSCANQEGYASHATDYLYYYIKEKSYTDKSITYFDFGTSNEDGGRYLNSKLISHKESFGARGVTYKQWKIDLGEFC